MAANKFAHTLVTLVATLAVSGAMAADNNPKPGRDVVRDYTRPLSFEPNRGQAGKQVDFLAHGLAYRLFLSHGEATLALNDGAAVRMRLAGATASSPPEPLDPQPSKSNYFIGNVPERWHTNIPNYAKVRYRNVYPGIDLIYHGNQRQLEYDLVVTPGSDPQAITLQFEGAAKTDLDRSGDLVMQTTAGEVRWHKPLAYQEINGGRKLVACDYLRKGEQLRFRLGAYDRSQPLIIDPELVYSTYLGGSAEDVGVAIAVDSWGNAYVTGYTLSSDFPTKNAFEDYIPGLNVLGIFMSFLSKFDANGGLVYSTYLGGSGVLNVTEDLYTTGDTSSAIAVDAHGYAYVTGTTRSIDFPIKNAFQNRNNSCITANGGLPNPATNPCLNTEVFNVFVTKFGQNGDALVYSTYLGGTGGALGAGIAVDPSGTYVTGSAFADFPIKNAFQDELRGTSNAFVTKFDMAGAALVYSTYLGGSGSDVANTIAIDSNGHAYVAGLTNSSNFPTKHPFQKELKSSNGNAFVAKLDRDGDALAYSTYLGGSGNRSSGRGDQATGIAVDDWGHAYVTGDTASSDFPVRNAFQKKLKSSDGNAFVTKLDRDGDSLIYASYLGGSTTLCGTPFCGDEGHAIAVNGDGEAYVTGITSSTDFPITKDAFHSKLESANGNAFITKFDRDGDSLVYSTYLGGSGFGDSGNGIALDRADDVYVTGQTTSTNFPTKNAFQDQAKTVDGTVFVTKISAH